MKIDQSQISTRNALRFVILIGVVSLFADMTYEGARSINGSYLAVLGASGAVVGVVSGLGELLGFTIRLVSGYLSDETKGYWTITFLGYAINLIAVPLLALAGNWPLAALLMVVERLGKGIRVPPRDAMLSYATQRMGRGWGFGLHEALDQLGAITGPLIVALVLYFRNGYQTGYGLLLIPALLALGVLSAARLLYPRPQDLEFNQVNLQVPGFSRPFWLYVAAAALIAAGFADFPLIAYHFQKASIAGEATIPVLYAVAMGVDALAALVFGRLFDRFGLVTMMLVAALSAFFCAAGFLGRVFFSRVRHGAVGHRPRCPGIDHARRRGGHDLASTARHGLRAFQHNLWHCLVLRQRVDRRFVRSFSLLAGGLFNGGSIGLHPHLLSCA